MENLTEQKPLTKHIQTAVNAIEKEIEKRQNKVLRFTEKAAEYEYAAEELRQSISGLQAQISKLKGE